MPIILFMIQTNNINIIFDVPEYFELSTRYAIIAI